MYRFLLTPRWLAGHLFVVLACVFCVFMGSWQLSRFESRVETHRTAEKDTKAAAAARPVALAKLLPNAKSQVTTVSSGRAVTATGRYDTARQLLVPDRTLDGRTGFYVLTPLRVADGTALPVVRGWLPGKASAAAVPAAPAGQVTVTGALQAPETTSTDGAISSGGLPEGQLGMISAASLVNLLPYDVYSAWITQSEAVAAPSKPSPRPSPRAPASTSRPSRTSATPASGSSSPASSSSCGSGSSAARRRPSATPRWACRPSQPPPSQPPRCRSAKSSSSRSCLIRSSTTSEPCPAS